jgi:outer membrane cobalamin receptor
LNVDEVNSQGLEILANTTINDWNIKAEYNHNKSREGNSTQQADRRPEHTINFSANKQF